MPPGALFPYVFYHSTLSIKDRNFSKYRHVKKMLGVPTTTPSCTTMDVPVCMYVRKKFEGNARDVSNTMKHVL